MNTRFHGLSLAIVLGLITALGPATVYGENGIPPIRAPEAVSGTPNGTAFTYQGQLRKTGNPVNALCAFTFTLWDAASSGVQIGPIASAPAVAVAGGLFSANLDFGTGAMNGESRWLDAQVQCPGDGAPIALSPRTALLPAPYAQALPGMRTPRGNNDGNGLPTVSVIGGTVSNTVTPDSILSTIGGGTLNAIGGDSGGSVIAGGNTNVITDVSYNSALGGGYGNSIVGRSEGVVLAGGIANIVTGDSDESALGGGYNNRIDGTSTWSVLAGGYRNTISGTSTVAVVGGGSSNVVSGTVLGVVAGGNLNILDAARNGVIAGGEKNIVRGSQYAATSGGVSNTISSSDVGVIGGGFNNKVSGGSHYSVIGGGANNRASLNSTYSFVGGGGANAIEFGSNNSVVAGGEANNILTLSYMSVIGGGTLNEISQGSNRSIVAGGSGNAITGNEHSSIGGGQNNTITGTARWATIPGGFNNKVTGDFAMAAGRRAQALHDGSFVWGDSTDASIASTAANQFVVRASGGVSLPVNAGEGGTHPFGERWRDNGVQAWAVIRADGLIYSSYGVSTVTHSTGIYTFTLQVGAQDNVRMAPVVSPEIDAPPTSAAAARLMSVNTMTGKIFAVYITNGSYALVDNDFLMILTGR